MTKYSKHLSSDRESPLFPLVRRPILPPGAALIDQTLLVEAARLFSARDEMWRPGESSDHVVASRLLQLELLARNALLHETLYILPGENPSSYEQLDLRDGLIEAGVVRELDLSPDDVRAVDSQVWAMISRGLAGERGQRIDDSWQAASRAMIASPVHAAYQVGSGQMEWYLRHLFSGRSLDSAIDGLREERAREHLTQYEMLTPSALECEKGPFYGIIEALKAASDRRAAQTAVLVATTSLRSLVYWRVAAYFNVPFQPSWLRMLQVQGLESQARSGAQDLVYSAVAEAFGCAIEDVSRDNQAVDFSMPPALTLMLDRLRDGMTPDGAVIDMRSEFADFRRRLAELNEAFLGNATIGDRLKIKTDLARIAEAVTQRHSTDHADAWMRESLNLLPDATAVLLDPLDPRSYQGFSRMTSSRIKDWWGRRSLRFVFPLTDALSAVERPALLLSESMGLSVSGDDLRLVHRDLSVGRWPTIGSP